MDRLSDSDLWSRVDRHDPDLEGYLERFPEDRERVDELRDLVGGVRAAEETAARETVEELPDRIGPYEIVGRLGAGGMGIVYDAREEHPRRAVALKVQRPGLAAVARDRFEREIRTLARLEHPSIARLYAAGEHEGAPWFAMERVQGRPLDEYVRAQGLRLRERIELFEAIVRAVAFAHSQGVVHRDLKPQNVLVAEDGTPRIVDFGLARLVDVEGSLASQTGTGLIGTLAYMSPEQAQGGAVDERSDVYGLGAILYELLADRRPRELDGLSLFAAMRNVGDREPRPLATLDRALPDELCAITGQALAHEPKDRYSTAEELAADVERWLAGHPVRAARPTWRRRLWKRMRRHAVVTVMLFALFALGALALYQSATPTTWLADLPWTGGTRLAPFDELRWRGDVPIVRIAGDERLFEVERIEGLYAEHITGTFRQWQDENWRKRFSEDLIPGLRRLGCWVFFSVDLELIDCETRERVFMEDVELRPEHRRRVWSDRNAWPFVLEVLADSVRVRYEDRAFELVELCGLPVERTVEVARELGELGDASLRIEREGGELRLTREEGQWLKGSGLFDVLCEALGRSPERHIAFTLRDPLTGTERSVVDFDRHAVFATER